MPVVCYQLIYNSRNFWCGLDQKRFDLDAEIYNSRNFWCGLDMFTLYVVVPSTTVEIFGVVWTGIIADSLIISTTVEIFGVVWTFQI